LNELSPYDLDRISSNERVYKRLSKARTLIIDEVSMLDAKTLSMVDAVCRETRRSDRPFGGLQIVLVGDFFQLPPVARAGTKAEFAFRSPGWSAASPVTCYLSEQHRQDDTAFLAVLSAIRSNVVGEEHLSLLEARASVDLDVAPDAVKLFSHNVDVDRLNDKELAQLPESGRVFTMESKGPEHLVESLKRGCLSPEKLVLKPGAAVMFTRNNPAAGFANGTLGTVVKTADSLGHPMVRTSAGEMISVEPMEWRIEDQGRVLASVTQIPLRLAWAMTVHKSQGMSLDAALVDLGAAFEYGQGYVALSRVRRLSGLFIRGRNERALEVHPEILAEDRAFRAASLAAESELAKITAEAQAKAERNFIVTCGGHLDTSAPSPEKKTFLEEKRAKHPKAYERWTEAEEAELIKLFHDETPVKEMMKKLGRQRGGINSRLRKLGLVE
jgi:hypothetical protein